MESSQVSAVKQITPLALEKSQLTSASRCQREGIKSEEAGSENNNMLETDSDESQLLDGSSSWEDFFSTAPALASASVPNDGKTTTNDYLAPGTPTYIAKDANSLTFQWEQSKPASALAKPLYYVEMQQVSAPSGASTPDNGLARTLVDHQAWEDVWCGTECWTQVKMLKPGRYYAVRIRCDWTLKGDIDSIFSSVVVFHTTSTIPAAPQPPSLIGIHGTSLRLQWMDPIDNGGSEITGFRLQVSACLGQDLEDFVEVYNGYEKTFEVQQLQPFTKYKTRVKALNDIGEGAWSLCSCFKTKAMTPLAPRHFSGSVLSPTSVHLVWSQEKQRGRIPDQYEIEFEDIRTGACYYRRTGSNTECEIKELACEIDYAFRVRSNNEVGPSDWSFPVNLHLAALPPSPPSCPIVVSCSQTTAAFTWHPPLESGGKAVSLYLVEMMIISPNFQKMNAPLQSWSVVYKGPSCDCLVKDLHPGCDYHIRVKANNTSSLSLPSSEWSQPSIVLSFRMRAGPPEKPCTPQAVEHNLSSMKVYWTVPRHDGGLPIEFYTLKCCPVSRLTGDDGVGQDPFTEVYKGKRNQVDLVDLIPGTVYAIRVKAVHQMGASEWSDVGYESTKAGIPSAPKHLHITNLRDLKFHLRWEAPRNGGAPISGYAVVLSKCEISHYEKILGEASGSDLSVCNGDPYSHQLNVVSQNEVGGKGGDKVLDFREVYSGPLTECVVDGLAPSSSYVIKAKAINKHGDSLWSELIGVQTESILPKKALSHAKAFDVTSRSVQLTWDDQRLENLQNGRFIVEMISSNEKGVTAWTEIWKGAQNQCLITDLAPGKEFHFRIFDEEQGVEESEEISIQTESDVPQVPSLIRISQVTSSSMKIEWNPLSPKDKNGSFVKFYHITLQPQKKSENCETIVEKLTSSTHFVKVGNLSPNMGYEIRLAAENCVGLSAWSEALYGKTKLAPPLAPQDITFSTKSINEDEGIEIRWQKAPDQQGEATCHYSESYDIEVYYYSAISKKSSYKNAQRLFAKVTVSGQTFYFCRNLESNQKYEVQVRGVSASGVFGRWSRPSIMDTFLLVGTEDNKTLIKDVNDMEDSTFSQNIVEELEGDSMTQENGQPRRTKKGQIVVSHKRTNPLKRRKSSWKVLRSYMGTLSMVGISLLIFLFLFLSPTN